MNVKTVLEYRLIHAYKSLTFHLCYLTNQYHVNLRDISARQIFPTARKVNNNNMPEAIA